ncbi:DUF2726 domain-containing protein [Citrobacter portucalensis]|uniref:hypothetical protein n=1 Tax=Citrobacter portucalensis TaxID=1639133 RepID=UPI00314014FA
MSETMINFIGVVVVIIAAWYFQIYRPRKQLKSPGEIKILPVLNSRDREISKAINKLFPEPCVVKNNVSLSSLLYLTNLTKNQVARKKLESYKVDWLIIDGSSMPVLAITYPASSDELMLDWLAQAGIGCMVIESSATTSQLEAELELARMEVIKDNTPDVAPEKLLTTIS